MTERAREFAAQAYGDPAELEHPLEVAQLVRDAGFPDEVVAAAVLHDLIEDTELEASQIAAEFGSPVAALVSTLTEDASIANRAARKAEHRARACAAGDEAAAVFVADKLSNARRMRRGVKKPKKAKIAHYAATLELMRRHYPGLPLIEDLERELTALHAELQGAAA